MIIKLSRGTLDSKASTWSPCVGKQIYFPVSLPQSVTLLQSELHSCLSVSNPDSYRPSTLPVPPQCYNLTPQLVRTIGSHLLTHTHTVLAVAAPVSDMAFYPLSPWRLCFVNSSKHFKEQFKKSVHAELLNVLLWENLQAISYKNIV